MALYAVDLCMCALSYTVLQLQIIKAQGPSSLLSEAVGRDTKGKISLAAYLAAVPLAMLDLPLLSGLLILAVACMWLIPDRRIERKMLSE
jgi:uncharacterized membrane protein